MPTAEEQAALDAAAEEEAAAQAAEAETEAGEEFDKERALATIKAQRESENGLKAQVRDLAAKLKEHEDAKKTKEERDAEAKASSDREAAEAKAEVLRLKAAIKYGLDEEDLDLLGTGDEEQIEARAQRLSERSAPKEDEETEEVSRRPRERLRTGAAAKTEPEKTDPQALAADVPRGW